MPALSLIIAALAREHLRWARSHLYLLLVLSPLVLGLTYFGIGRIVDSAELELTPGASMLLAVGVAGGLIGLSMSRAGGEIYHLRRPESFFDALPLSADTHLGAALIERITRTLGVGLVALIARTIFGETLADWRLLAPLLLFVPLAALAEMLATIEWIHWSREKRVTHAVVTLALLVPSAIVCGLLLLAVVQPKALSDSFYYFLILAGAAALIATLLPLVRRVHRKWRAADIEHAKRLTSRRQQETSGAWLRRRLKDSPSASLFERDIRLTQRAFSSAVYVVAALSLLWIVALAALLTGGAIPRGDAPASLFDATFLPQLVAVKISSVLAAVTLASLTAVLVAHQTHNLWVERAVGVKGEDVWRAKLWYARLVSLPAPLAAWIVGIAAGASPAFYVLPFLGEVLWLWWLVSTLAGALAYEVPEQPGLAVILMACAGLAAGLFVSALWPIGFALYALAVGPICMRGEQRARFHLLAEAE